MEDTRIVELDYGTWEGKTYAEVIAEDSSLYRAWDADPGALAPPEGETGLEGVARIVTFLDEVARRHLAKRDHIVVVTHKTVCRLAACHVLGLPVAEYRRRLSMANTALNIFEPTKNGWRLVLLNDTSHLTAVHIESASLDSRF